MCQKINIYFCSRWELEWSRELFGRDEQALEVLIKGSSAK